ncbi:MAG: signal peptidase I [Bacillota bacterium]|nr:signal peptidase I [Bacillota bacterium]
MRKGKLVLYISEIIIIIIILNFFGITYVQGNSMQPTLSSGDLVLYLKNMEYKKNDVIIFKSDNANMLLIKRIAATSGEMVEVKDNHILIDAKDIGESYYTESFEILEKEYFVLGDNLDESEDSRSERIGMISRSAIIGRAIFRILPLNRWGKI